MERVQFMIHTRHTIRLEHPGTGSREAYIILTRFSNRVNRGAGEAPGKFQFRGNQTRGHRDYLPEFDPQDSHEGVPGP